MASLSLMLKENILIDRSLTVINGIYVTNKHYDVLKMQPLKVFTMDDPRCTINKVSTAHIIWLVHSQMNVPLVYNIVVIRNFFTAYSV